MSDAATADSAVSLPIARTPLVGRARELAAARALLLDDGVPLLTLSGAGGVGKTRLALAIAHEVAHSFAAGTTFVDLSPLRDPAHVLPSIAQQLGIPDAGDRPLDEQLAAALRSRQLLLVLDNCEQVLAAAPQIAGLLAACPALQILTTSRAVLRVRGEHALLVQPLALPDAAGVVSPAHLATTDAVTLFLQRARAANPAFALTGANAAAVAEVVRRLDGLPLAIELAAPSLRLLSPQALLALLTQRLRVLTAGERDLPARHQTLSDTIAWSYHLLSDEARVVFRRLGVFAGGFDIDSAVAIAADGDTEAAIARVGELVEHSLVRRDDHPDGTVRYRLLETIRDYALERLDACGEAATVHDTHAGYVLSLAETPKSAASSEFDLWLDRLERDHDNLRAALGWLRGRGDVGRGLRLATALGRYFENRGSAREGRIWIEDFLSAAAGMPAGTLPPAGLAGALSAAGNLAFAQGDFAHAAARHEASLALFDKIGDRSGVAWSLMCLGVQAWHRGDPARAEAFLADSLNLFRELDDGFNTATALVNLGGVVNEYHQDTERARALYEESLPLYRAVGSTGGVELALINLGEVAARRGDYERAVAFLIDADAPRSSNRPYVASLLGQVALWRGNLVDAAALQAESLRLRRGAGHRPGIAQSLERLAAVAAAAGHHQRAAAFVGAAEAERLAAGAPTPPPERTDRERALQAARANLGEGAFDTAVAAGRALPIERAIAEALTLAAEVATPPTSGGIASRETEPEAASAPHDPFGLSPRERQVLALLAQRWTDPEIAARLFLSPRTVQSHVRGVFNKLGVSNRRDAAAIAARAGLT